MGRSKPTRFVNWKTVIPERREEVELASEGRWLIRGSGSEFRSAVLLEREELRQLVMDLTGVGSAGGGTFGELAADWLDSIARVRVCPANEQRHVEHMMPLLGLSEGELTKGAIEKLFGALLVPSGPLGPATVNKLRSTGRLIIRNAQGNGLWRGLNPFELVRRLKEPEPVRSTLTVAQANAVLPHLRPDRRRLAKTVLLTGVRPGEALGLRKEDVDLNGRMLTIRRSHGRNQTKTGKVRAFPIPDELVSDLAAAMGESSSALVFPRPDGTRQRADTKLARILRTAIKKAGLVTGYRYSCRRKGCGFREELEAEVDLSCPSCGMSLWCSPIPIRFRFYDLRHSAATLHRKAKCDPLVVRMVMGHASESPTDYVYTHLDEEYQRAELNKLKLGGGDNEDKKK